MISSKQDVVLVKKNSIASETKYEADGVRMAILRDGECMHKVANYRDWRSLEVYDSPSDRRRMSSYNRSDVEVTDTLYCGPFKCPPTGSRGELRVDTQITPSSIQGSFIPVLSP